MSTTDEERILGRRPHDDRVATPSQEVPSSPRWRNPRWVVLGFLLASFVWGPIIAVSFTAPPTTALTVAYAGGVVLYGFVLLIVLLDAIDPTRPTPSRLWKVTLLIAVTAALWAPAHLWAEPGGRPWAWLAGFAIAASALVAWQGGVAAAVVLGAAAAIGGQVFLDSPVPSLLTALGCAVVTWGMCQVLIWIHGLWRAAQEGREARADLAVAQERLRIDRELHDVLGQRLTVIALKAELAADLAPRDPVRAASESESIRELANRTLREARRAVQGEATTDLPTQLESARLVLASAGIDATIDADPEILSLLSPPMAALLASGVREAVTNLLRHSVARTATIRISAAPALVTLRVENDGAAASSPGSETSGTGLASLAARCASVGASLTAGPSGEDRFSVALAVPRTGGGVS